MEANKPFKTISLQERLAGSVMGSFDPKPSSVSPNTVTAQLKIVGNAPEKNAAILKQMAKTIKQPILPILPKPELTQLADRKLGKINRNFPNTIRLEDRLAQPLDSRTTHLAKYFVSDTYTGVVKANPFVTSPLASRVNVDPYGFADKGAITFHRNPDPLKGSPLLQEPLVVRSPIQSQADVILLQTPSGEQSVTLSQGVFTKNGAFISVTDPERMASDALVLLNQGTTVSNNIFKSVADTRLSVLPELITQGGVSSTKPKDTLSIAILQGLTTKEGEISASVLVPEEMDAIPSIIGGARRFPKAPDKFELPLLAVKEASTPIVNSSGQPVQPTNSYKLFAPILQNIDSNLDILKKELVGYGSAALPFGYSPAPYFSPTLQVIRYESDRLLARFAPTIKHGSAAIRAFQPEIRQGGTNIDQASLIPTTQYGPNKPFLNTGNVFSYAPAGIQSDTYWVNNANGTQPEIFQEGATVGFGNVNREVWANIRQALEAGEALPTDSLTNFPAGEDLTIGSLARYKALSYGEIESLGSAAAGNAGRSAQAASGPNPQIGTGNRTVQNVPDYNGKDYLTIKITSARSGGKSVNLKAYLDSFSDSFSTSWNDLQYVGRQDTFKQFKGVTRAVSFGVSLPAFSKVDLPINMRKIQDVVSITQIASFNGNYLTGPLCKLTLGGFFKNVYCVFNSVKVDVDTTAATWDIDNGLPHLFKLSFDVAMLGDANGNAFDANTSTYYNNYA
jgi:hypothetical protein